MPNGVSCAIFAGRNLVAGARENDIFREGIFCAQSVRTAEKVMHTGTVGTKVAQPVKTVFSSCSKIAEKILYPLIFCSGIYNVVKSDDKVRTAASQTGGIATMYAFEQVASKSLKGLDNKILNSSVCQKNKFTKIAWIVAKGLAYVTASITGFKVGSSGAENMVDNFRAKKEEKTREEEKPYNIFDEIVLK